MTETRVMGTGQDIELARGLSRDRSFVKAALDSELMTFRLGWGFCEMIIPGRGDICFGLYSCAAHGRMPLHLSSPL